MSGVSARPPDGADRAGAGASGEEEVSHEKNYMEAVRGRRHRANSWLRRRADQTLEELFAGKKYNGQREPQGAENLQAGFAGAEDYDADKHGRRPPYIVIVRRPEARSRNDDGPQAVEVQPIEMCAHDEARARAIRMLPTSRDIVQRLCTKPYFGGAFTVLKPIAWPCSRTTPTRTTSGRVR